MIWNVIMIKNINLSSKIKLLSEYNAIDADRSKHSSMYKNTDRPYFESRNKHLGLMNELVKNKYVTMFVMQ